MLEEKEREVLGFGSQVAVLSGVGNSVGEAGFSGKSVRAWGLFPPSRDVARWTCRLLWVGPLPGSKDN